MELGGRGGHGIGKIRKGDNVAIDINIECDGCKGQIFDGEEIVCMECRDSITSVMQSKIDKLENELKLVIKCDRCGKLEEGIGKEISIFDWRKIICNSCNASFSNWWGITTPLPVGEQGKECPSC